MLFNSFLFIGLFLPVVLAGTWLIGSARARVVFWSLASWTFYAVAGPWFLLLMLFSTVLDFVLAQAIAASASPRRRRGLMLVSIGSGLGLLGFFKYVNFFLDTVNASTAALAAVVGLPATTITSSLDIVLPAGISFYTFETIRYTVDVYRGEIPPERDFWYFACFVSLFPHLIAGPIIRPGDLLPQLHGLESRHRWRLQAGLFLFAAGLCKKVLIADRIAGYSDPVLADIAGASTGAAWAAMVGYALQIYFDFSGYTDMARGLGFLLGIEFPINFNSPYAAVDPSDFWRRWHITLSTWLRDYIYVPLGGSRHGSLATSRNLAVTMLLGGLWHGAGWNFVCWGGVHGAALMLYHHFGAVWDRLPRVARRAGMLLFVVLSWVPFRLHSFHDILACYRVMFSLNFAGGMPLRLTAYAAVAAIIAVGIRKNSNWIAWDRLGPHTAVILGLAACAALLYMNASTQFIYFQF
jgi:alginate O-acetyltransferase complex protein AlgI